MKLVYWNRMLMRENEYSWDAQSPPRPQFDNVGNGTDNWLSRHGKCSEAMIVNDGWALPQNNVGEVCTVVDVTADTRVDYHWDGSNWVDWSPPA